MATRFAIISDIHSNLNALEAVLEDISKKDVDAIYCLGDLVGYFTKPNEVIECIRNEGIISVLGNHDERIAHSTTKLSNPVKLSGSVDYTNTIISAENREFLKELPNTFVINGSLRVVMAHGSVESNTEYKYENDWTFADNLEYDVIITGHTHIPYNETQSRLTFDFKGFAVSK